MCQSISKLAWCDKGSHSCRLTSLLLLRRSPKDLRSKNTSGNETSGEVCILVEDHIRSYPTKKSHYSSREIEYLSERLNITLMHASFMEKYPDQQVSYWLYRKIFKERFSLSFGRPQIDTCCTCEQLSVRMKSPSLNDNAKRVAGAEFIVHKRRAKKFTKKMEYCSNLCKEDNETASICIDYMQNLHLPEIPVQEAFYLRQLNVNVFNIHNLRDNTAKLYIYHEGLVKKGPDEVCSFILDYISNELPNTTKYLHIFSDSCPGQNRNNTVVRFLQTLVTTGRLKKNIPLFSDSWAFLHAL